MKHNNINELWSTYKKYNRQKDREEIILNYLSLVRNVAGKLGAGLPQSVDQDDLISYGVFGLIDAIEKFEPERGFKFETYAIARIKGAILDELRSIDWIPRSLRAKAREVDSEIARLQTKFGRVPSPNELAKELSLSSEELSKLLGNLDAANTESLDQPVGLTTGISKVDLTQLTNSQDIDYDEHNLSDLVCNAIKNLSERETIVITLYYYENMTLSDIGNILGVTESRVCQIHTKAVNQLL